ncbi:hypothetical protein ACFQ0K_05640 [Nocardioides caeni]|uniref:Protein kinase domain-containing protein n=1 Tax=Nocardioides caeni TaxID=574700 RepID=A0A4S8N7K7_9ACTN|nr:hypothetical protein [Nocardioides caeni]THV12168.1 hypothetical protein E9934_12550 [Nocardioides caeni]
MGMGLASDTRATIAALLAHVAPEPLPAEQAIGLLQDVQWTDVAELGRLAYHALTGVDPGDGDPATPGEVQAGFPPFAAEVLMRAILGPDHRRPTAQALLIVLDTVPTASWPTAGRPFVTLPETPAEPVAVEEAEPAGPAEAEPEADPQAEPQADVAPSVEDGPPSESAPESSPESSAGPEIDTTPPAPVGRAALHAEFRSMLTPSREVPRFDPLSAPLPDVLGDPLRRRMGDPLTDPWQDDEDGGVPADQAVEPVETEPEFVEAEPVETEPESVVALEPPPAEEPIDQPHPEPTDEGAQEPIAEPVPEHVEDQADQAEEPEPVSALAEELEPATEPAEVVQVVQDTDPAAPRGMHEEFRNLVDPSFRPAATPSAPARNAPVAAVDPIERLEAFEARSGSSPSTEASAGAARDELSDAAVPRRTDRRSDRRPDRPSDPAGQGSRRRAVESRETDDDTGAGDRQQTLLLVALLVVIIVLGIVFATSRGESDADGSDDAPTSPQGASLVLDQPVDDRA